MSNDLLRRSTLMDVSQSSQGNQSTQLNTQMPSTTCTSSSAMTTSVHLTGSPRKQSTMDFATPAADVSAFCQAVLAKIVPNEFWSSAADHDKELIMRNVDRFVRMRRFESLSLHEVVQGIKVAQRSRFIDSTVLTDSITDTQHSVANATESEP